MISSQKLTISHSSFVNENEEETKIKELTVIVEWEYGERGVG